MILSKDLIEAGSIFINLLFSFSFYLISDHLAVIKLAVSASITGSTFYLTNSIYFLKKLYVKYYTFLLSWNNGLYYSNISSPSSYSSWTISISILPLVILSPAEPYPEF
jgi:hypothetical protein